METSYVKYASRKLKYLPGLKRTDYTGKYRVDEAHGTWGRDETVYKDIVKQKQVSTYTVQKGPATYYYKIPRKDGITSKEAFRLPRGGSVMRIVGSGASEIPEGYIAGSGAAQIESYKDRKKKDGELQDANKEPRQAASMNSDLSSTERRKPAAEFAKLDTTVGTLMNQIRNPYEAGVSPLSAGIAKSPSTAVSEASDLNTLRARNSEFRNIDPVMMNTSPIVRTPEQDAFSKMIDAANEKDAQMSTTPTEHEMGIREKEKKDRELQEMFAAGKRKQEEDDNKMDVDKKPSKFNKKNADIDNDTFQRMLSKSNDILEYHTQIEDVYKKDNMLVNLANGVEVRRLTFTLHPNLRNKKKLDTAIASYKNRLEKVARAAKKGVSADLVSMEM